MTSDISRKTGSAPPRLLNAMIASSMTENQQHQLCRSRKESSDRVTEQHLLLHRGYPEISMCNLPKAIYYQRDAESNDSISYNMFLRELSGRYSSGSLVNSETSDDLSSQKDDIIDSIHIQFLDSFSKNKRKPTEEFSEQRNSKQKKIANEVSENEDETKLQASEET